MKNRILVVEDERIISDLICMNLEAAGYETRAVYDGNEAAGLLREQGQEAADLALVDIMLPGMDGFALMELLVRMEKVLERTGKMKPELRYGDLVVDLNMHRVWEGGTEVDLKPMEFGLLTVFLKNRNVVLGRDRLLDLVWGSDFYGETRTVDVHVAKLRKKLKSAGAIKTIPKAGYMFEDDGL